MAKRQEQIQQIIEELGGPVALAASLNRYKGNRLTHQAVSRWHCRDNPGIPQRYWQQIIRLSGGEVTLSRICGVVE